jgi:hypothetical protein
MTDIFYSLLTPATPFIPHKVQFAEGRCKGSKEAAKGRKNIFFFAEGGK